MLDKIDISTFYCIALPCLHVQYSRTHEYLNFLYMHTVQYMYLRRYTHCNSFCTSIKAPVSETTVLRMDFVRSLVYQRRHE